MRYSDIKLVETQVLKESTQRITVGNTVYEVGNDLIRSGSSYAIFSGNSAQQYAQSRGLVVPPIEVIQAVYSQARKLVMPPRPNNPTDTNAAAHTQDIFRANNLTGFPSGLVAGHKKEVVASSNGRTRIYGGWTGSRIIQSDSSVHGGGYVDYSQGMRTCRIVSGSGADASAGGASAEQVETRVFAVGDSHAVAIGRSGGFETVAQNGAGVSAISRQLSRVPDGAGVVLSAGNNDVGSNPSSVVSSVNSMIRSLKNKGCTVVFVVFPPIDLDGAHAETYSRAGYTENYNAVRNALTRVSGADSVLQLSTSDINTGDRMKIHATSSAYSRIANQASQIFERATASAGGAGGTGGAGAGGAGVGGAGAGGLPNIAAASGPGEGSSFFGLFGRGSDINRIYNADAEETPDIDAEINAMVDSGLAPEGAVALDSEGRWVDAEGEVLPMPPGSVGSAAVGPASTPNQAVNGVLDFIARYESGGDYNLRNGGSRANLTSMTINEVFEMQRGWRSWPNAASTASGRYQYIKGTLEEMVRIMNLDPATTRFDERTQDAIATRDLRRRCRLDDWLAGTINDATFMNLISRVWAGIPNTSGQSTYAGVANNRAGTSAQNALAQLGTIRTGTATA